MVSEEGKLIEDETSTPCLSARMRLGRRPNPVRRRQALGHPTPAHFLNRWTTQRKANAVSQNIAGPLLKRSAFTKKIPTVSLRRLLFNSNVRSGNIPALFPDLTEEYGPVFKIHPPLSKPMIFLAGTETNY